MKKILSFALALMMVVSLMPAIVANVDAAGNTIVPYATTAPTIDGVVADGEWGEPYQSLDYSTNASRNEAWPSKMDCYMTYTDEGLYIAAVVVGGHMTTGTNADKGTYFTPRTLGVNANAASDYLGCIALNKAGNALACDTFMTAEKGTTVAMTINKETKVAVFEAFLEADSEVMAFTDIAPYTTFKMKIGYNTFMNAEGNVLGFNSNDDTRVFGPKTSADEKPELPSSSGALRTVLPYTVAPVLDGNLSEWGDPEFKLNYDLTGGVRSYCRDYFSGNGNLIVDTKYYWTYDDEKFYVALDMTLPEYRASKYYLKNWSDVTLERLQFKLGNSDILVNITNGTLPTLPDGVEGAMIVNGTRRTVELSFDRSLIASGTSFLGYIEHYIEFYHYTIDTEQKSAGTSSVRTASVNLYDNTAANRKANDLFWLTVPTDDEQSSTGPSATPNPNPTTPGLNPGLTPGTPTVTPNPAPSTPAVSVESFVDISENAWYYDSVAYVVEAGLMNGVSGNEFAPENELTRAMLTTVLWRLAGEPTVNANTFDDVISTDWYSGAVNWAASEGIVKGYAGSFNPGGGLTLEQLAAILHRYSDMMGYRTSDFSNRYYKTSDWAEADVAWADANGLLDIPCDVEDMTETASRAQIAAILAVFLQNIAA